MRAMLRGQIHGLCSAKETQDGGLMTELSDTLAAIPASHLHLSRLRPVTREDGCTLYQSRDPRLPAVWRPEDSAPDPLRWRVLYAADWPEES